MFDPEKLANTAKALDLSGREVTYGDTTFRFGVIGAMDGYRILGRIRPLLSGSLSQVEAKWGNDSEIAETIARCVLALPEGAEEKLAGIFFRWVRWKTPTSAQWELLAGHESEPWAGLTPVHVYLVLVQALFVNFTMWSGAIRSLMGGDGDRTTPLPSPETSPQF